MQIILDKYSRTILTNILTWSKTISCVPLVQYRCHVHFKYISGFMLYVVKMSCNPVYNWSIQPCLKLKGCGGRAEKERESSFSFSGLVKLEKLSSGMSQCHNRNVSLWPVTLQCYVPKFFSRGSQVCTSDIDWPVTMAFYKHYIFFCPNKIL